MVWTTLVAWMACASLAGLAGCTSNPGTPGVSAGATCPQWVENPAMDGYTGSFTGGNNETHLEHTIGRDRLQLDSGGKSLPLDLVQIDFHWNPRGGTGETNGVYVEDSIVTGRFVRSDDNAPVHAFMMDEDDPHTTRADWTFGPGPHANFTLQLSLADSDAPAHPGEVKATWDLQRNLDGKADTHSAAFIKYRIHYLYRVCGT